MYKVRCICEKNCFIKRYISLGCNYNDGDIRFAIVILGIHLSFSYYPFLYDMMEKLRGMGKDVVLLNNISNLQCVPLIICGLTLSRRY